MRFLTFLDSGQPRLGVKTADGIIDVATAKLALWAQAGAIRVPQTMSDLLTGGTEALDAVDSLVNRAQSLGMGHSWLMSESGLHLGPCVPHPGKIFCVGLNYKAHAAETHHDLPEHPVLFAKFRNALAGSGQPVVLPAAGGRFDYEAELCVIIGRRASRVSEAEALNYVFGYCCANDVSERELQHRTSQWLLGKTLDRCLPLGPYAVTADEVPDPQALRVRCWLNGDLRQDDNTAEMIFPVARLVSYISQYIPLDPGDVIATGTPPGVIDGRAEKVWIKAGDRVVVEVGELGQLVTPFISETEVQQAAR